MRIVALLLVVLVPCSRAANLIHNGSFEVGASGWIIWGSPSSTSYGNEMAVAEHVVSTNGSAVHGAKSIHFLTRLQGRPMWLTNGSYVVTFSARTESAGTIQAGLIRTYRMNFDLPPDTVSITTSWQRFTNTYTAATNGWHVIKFYDNGGPTRTWVDAVQVEPGTVASAFEPSAVIEVGMDTADYGNNLFLSDAKTLRFNLWNHGPQTNVTVPYQIVSGIWNSNIAIGDITTNALSASTNTTINLALPALWGDMRITAYVTNVNATWAETRVAALPYAAQSGRDTNGMLGIHTHWSPYHLTHARRLGFCWTRIGSPTTDFRWETIFPTLSPPTTNLGGPAGGWFADWVTNYLGTNDLTPFIILSAGDASSGGGWHPETNASFAVMIGDWTNYVGRVVNRYYGTIKHWEIWNEPQQPGGPVGLSDPNKYAGIYTNAARLIKTIDSTAVVIGFGGYSSAAEVAAGWAAISPQGRTDMDFASVHNYPQSTGLNDPNLPDDDNPPASVSQGEIARTFTSKPIWNTETGVYDAGGYHTINVAFAYPYYWGFEYPEAAWTSEAWFNEEDTRQLSSTDRITYNFCRSAGWGYKQFNFQNGRMQDETALGSSSATTGGHPTMYEPDGTIKPWAVAMLMANYFVEKPGTGRVTNDTALPDSYWIEAYLHTGTTKGTVSSLWNCDKGNRTLTWTNGPLNAAFYDGMGNLISTNAMSIKLTRSVRFLVSGTTSANVVSNAIKYATVSTNQDTTAPSLTIDFSPIGTTQVWGGVTNAFKALAIDETVLAYASAAIQTDTMTNVMYRWSINRGTNWSPWGQTNHFYHSFAGGSDMYDVRWQAKDKANNETPVVKTPYFGTLEALDEPPVPTTINVGTLNLGTITIVP